MSTYWISNEAEKFLKIAYAYHDAVMEEAEDDEAIAIALASKVAVNRMIRRQPVRVNECPACRKYMMIPHNFCPDCGQALDWQQEG